MLRAWFSLSTEKHVQLVGKLVSMNKILEFREEGTEQMKKHFLLF